jgi:hypothetical protein
VDGWTLTCDIGLNLSLTASTTIETDRRSKGGSGSRTKQQCRGAHNLVECWTSPRKTTAVSSRLDPIGYPLSSTYRCAEVRKWSEAIVIEFFAGETIRR